MLAKTAVNSQIIVYIWQFRETSVSTSTGLTSFTNILNKVKHVKFYTDHCQHCHQYTNNSIPLSISSNTLTKRSNTRNICNRRKVRYRCLSKLLLHYK